WLPAGTHDWRKFVIPVEMGQGLRDAGLRVADVTGMAPDLLTGRWRTTRDLAVNYMVMAAS
ncbi:MAG TPA: bifunctional 3-demethylubiquinol 3-O-methyltransferase/2-polyprenyl-6-hydroxyphenol methylase, partial [Acetobacteraceae bacterium]